MASDFDNLPETDRLDLVLRSTPHTYAEYVTYDPKTGKSAWQAARHLAYIGTRIAAGVAKGGLRLMVNMPPRYGKACAHSTPVLTTKGWKTHGDILQGDYVFGLDGKPTRVVAVGNDCWADRAVRFVQYDGLNEEVIKSHHNHEWVLTGSKGGPVAASTDQVNDLMARRDYTQKGLWVPQEEVFDVPRSRHRIVEVSSCFSQEPGRCIQVEAADGIYRVGRNQIPTHNSMLISKWTPIWFLETYPHKNIIVCSYGKDLAEYWGAEARNEIDRNPLIRFKLREDSQAVGRWRTQQGGGMKAEGVGGQILGFGYDLGLVDDPIKNYEEAISPVVQEGLWTWWQSTFLTRKEPGANIVILMHRWAINDFCGRLLQEDGGDEWEVVKFPCEALPGDPLGRQPGETLWPERWAADCKEIREAKKTIVWDSMYQQNPKLENASRVYDHFTQDQNISRALVLRKGGEEVLALTLDFNTNPGMHGEVGQYDGREDMFHVHREFHQLGWRTEHLMKAFIDWVRVENGGKAGCPWKYVAIYGDRSGNSPTTVTTQTDYGLIKKMLNEAGIPFKMYVPFKNPTINDRVLTVNMALCDLEGRVHMKVHPSCTRLIADLGTQPRDADGQPSKEDPALGHACFIAGTRVLTNRGDVSIEDVQVGDRAWTRKGWRRVSAACMTGVRATVVGIRLSNGKELWGTPNHPVWVEKRGFVPLAFLKPDDILESVSDTDRSKLWVEKADKSMSLNGSMVLNFAGILHQNGCLISDISEGRSGATRSDFTDTSGKKLMAQYQEDTTSTTRTRITPTTVCLIWSCCWEQITSAFTAASRKILNGSLSFSQRLGRLLRCGRERQKVIGTISNMPQSNNSESLIPSVPLYVPVAVKPPLSRYLENENSSTVPMPAKPSPGTEPVLMMYPESALFVENGSPSTSTTSRIPAGVHVVSLLGTGTNGVYNITVEDAHEYYANGVLAKNCDALGYWNFWVRPVSRAVFKPQRVVGGSRR